MTNLYPINKKLNERHLKSTPFFKLYMKEKSNENTECFEIGNQNA